MSKHRPYTPFKERFLEGYFVEKIVSLELITMARSPVQLLIVEFETIRSEVGYRLFGHHSPTREQIDDYRYTLDNARWGTLPPPPPWIDWRIIPLPEPVYTNVRPVEGGWGIVITQVYGGVLDPEWEEDVTVAE
jgi:hypothetical protein